MISVTTLVPVELVRVLQKLLIETGFSLAFTYSGVKKKQTKQKNPKNDEQQV